LFLLSAYMVNFRLYQDAGTSLDTLGSRAFAAARSGVEWGAFNSLVNNACAASTPLTMGGTLNVFTVTVTCSRSTFNEAGVIPNTNTDTIVATACNDVACPPASPGKNYVERQLSVMVSR